MAIQNILIVESFNDKAFINLIINDLMLTDAVRAEEIETIDLHKFPDPENPSKELRGKASISKKLSALRSDLRREEYKSVKRIGIVLDMDQESLAENLNLVNQAIESAFDINVRLNVESQMFPANISLSRSEQFQIEFSCFFTKDNSGQGNLDTLLYEIRKNPELPIPYADCLIHWRDCVEQSDSPLKVTSHLYQKIWMDHFLRAKTFELSSRTRKSILKDFEDKKYIVYERFGSDIFDLKHQSLSNLRSYISMFKD